MTKHSIEPHDHNQDASSPTASTELKDPVCGMTVTADSAHHLEQLGHSYYSFSAKCVSKFNDQPENYTNPNKPTHQ